MNYTKAKDLQIGQHVYRWGEEGDKQDEVLAVIIEEERVGVQWDWGSYVIWYKLDHPLAVYELQDKLVANKVWHFYEGSDYNDCIDWLSEFTDMDGGFRIEVYKLGIE